MKNYVLFNPVITSNVEYHKLDFYLNNYQKRINIGDYIPKDVYLRANFYLKNNVDELTVFTFNGVNIGYRRSPYDDTAFNIGYIYNYDSPQEVNITIDEYIRYEEIVQPYPLLFEFTDENGNLISWGGKAKVGNTITRTKSVSNANILAGLYNTNNYKLNGKLLEGNSYVVEKSMVFTCTATWAFDNNEPKCILSPRLLRIPNSSYKILGYIPDISGHGNHGKINNSAYEGMSGYNGYPVVFGANKTWESLSGVYGYTSDVTNTTIHVTHAEHAGNGLLFSYVKKDGALANIKEIPAFRVTIGGLEGNSKVGYRYLATEDATEETLVYLDNGTHELAKSFAPTEALLDLTRNVWVGIFITPMVEGEVVFDCDITIEVLPEYENGLAYDGITDYSKNANIPVLTDYTYIYKRTIINIPTNAATLLKGADKTNGGAFIADYGNKWQFNFGQYNTIQGIADGINWQTVNSFNGTSINKGENTDDSGITVAKFSNGYTSIVFYKLILYPKTISLLEINFLKNLMEKDEIIDLNNPIFIKNE